MSNFVLGCVAVGLILVLPELCEIVRKIAEEK